MPLWATLGQPVLGTDIKDKKIRKSTQDIWETEEKKNQLNNPIILF